MTLIVIEAYDCVIELSDEESNEIESRAMYIPERLEPDNQLSLAEKYIERTIEAYSMKVN